MSEEIKNEEIKEKEFQGEAGEKEENENKKEEENEEKEVKVPEKFKDIVEKIENLTVVELSELIKVLEEKFGVSASAVAAGGAVAGGGEAGGGEEKTEFNVVLKSAGDQKINVIKIIREVTGLGIKEAKDLVDNAPKPIKEGVKKEEAEELVSKLKEAGGAAELE